MGFAYTNIKTSTPSMGGFSSNTVDFNFQSINVNEVEVLEDFSSEKSTPLETYDTSTSKNDLTNYAEIRKSNDEFKSSDKVVIDLSLQEEMEKDLVIAMKRTGATTPSSILSLIEGIYNIIETGADILYFINSIMTVPLIYLSETITKKIAKKNNINVYDFSFTEDYIECTKALIAKDHTKSIFDYLYDNTSFGRLLKNKSYKFDKVRNFGNGLGKTAAVIGISVLTAGVGTGVAAGEGAAIGGTSITGTMTAFGGATGFGSGLQKSFKNGTSIKRALVSATANGLWEGTQYFTGAKIAGFTPTLSATKNALVRVGLDSSVGALDGFIRPAINSIDSGDSYLKSFYENGGFTNVLTNAGTGAFLSSIGEKSLRNYVFFGKIKSNIKGDIDPIYRNQLIDEFDHLFRNDHTSNHDVIDYYINIFKASNNKDAIKLLEEMINLKKRNYNYRLAISDYFGGAYYRPAFENGFRKISINNDSVLSNEQTTGLHELGHLLHDYVVDNYFPDNLEDICTNSKIFSSGEGYDARVKFVEESTNLYNKIDSEEINKIIVENFDSEEEYTKFLKANLIPFLVDEDKEGLSLLLKEIGFDLKTINYVENALFESNNVDEILGFDYDQAEILIPLIAFNQKEITKCKIISSTYEKKYGDYVAISDIIDATYRGNSVDINNKKMNLLYTHGEDYYRKRQKHANYMEMVANYISIKAGSNPQMIKKLREIVGDELVNELDKTYQMIIKDSSSIKLNSVPQTVNDAKGIIRQEAIENILNGDNDDK